MNNQPKLLLVEDEQSLQEVIELNLNLKGYNVTTESDGLNALQRIKNGYFDLVILDVMLPSMSGFEVCEQVRKINKSLQILMMSAKDSSSDKIKGLKLLNES